MGLNRENGYSASVEGFLVVEGTRFRLAKTNGVNFVLVESCELAPGTDGELLIIVDGNADAKRITLPNGVKAGQSLVRYDEYVPF
jgi:hypothetical protein